MGIDKLWAGIYIETPVRRDSLDRVYQDCDEHPTKESLFQSSIYDKAFPQIRLYSVKSRFKSKFFTGNSETILKRIRNGRYNIYSQGGINIFTISIPYDDTSGLKRKSRPAIVDVTGNQISMPEFDDARIDRIIFQRVVSQFLFNPTDKWASRVWAYTNTTVPTSLQDIKVIEWHPDDGVTPITTTKSNELTTIQPTPYIDSVERPNNQSWDDAVSKPVLFSIEIETDLRTEINSIGFHWRTINSYLH